MHLVLICLLLTSFSTIISSAQANSQQSSQSKNKQTQRELEQLKEKIKQVKASLNKINRSKNKQLYELKQSELKINSIGKKLYQTNHSLKKLNTNYRKINQQFINEQHKLAEHQSILSQQLTTSFQTGQQEFIKLLLNQEDPATFNRIMTYYEYFNRARLEKIAEVNSLVEKIDIKRTKIQLMQQEIALKKHLYEEEKITLDINKQQQNRLIKQLIAQQNKTSNVLNRLVKDKKRLDNLLKQIRLAVKKMAKLKQKKPFNKLKGKLFWPTKGKLRRLFGHWRSANKVKWNGHIIKNKEGSSVHSIAHGRVVFSDWFRGYGLLTIIDHGKQYMSLYGHSQSLLKAVGDIVYAGEQIATSGRSGGRKNSGTYFEIRYKGQAINPSRWCKKMPR